MPKPRSLSLLNKRIVTCRRCPRLIDHCRRSALQKPARFSDSNYWARPVSNFADTTTNPRLLILGLAPAAHGANRTGRMFTGDQSGNFLYRAMYETGFANQFHATCADDGLALHDALITAACHCAPPGNKPTREELDNCASWLDQTFDLMTDLRVILCLGRIAMDSALKMYQRRDWIHTRAAYPFAHGSEHRIPGTPVILCSYHPSQQNTFTGKLTQPMLIKVLKQARMLARQRGARPRA